MEPIKGNEEITAVDPTRPLRFRQLMSYEGHLIGLCEQGFPWIYVAYEDGREGWAVMTVERCL